MTDLLHHVEDSCRARKLLRRGEPVLVAVSGGVDSMVLLHVLHALSKKHGWRLAVAHFNHELRGRSSDADERLVRKIAASFRLKAFVERKAVKAIARERKQSIEMTARDLRHQFLAQTARRLKCKVIALAHHADDQVELFFLRLFRGAGGDGLAGMKWQNASPAFNGVRLIRPMLDVRKCELEEFARNQEIQFREDATNQCLDIHRNRIRHQLLPQLRREYQPALEKTILRTMEIARGESDAVTEAAEKWFENQQPFEKLPIGVQRRTLLLQLQRQKIVADFELIEALRCAAETPIMVNPKVIVERGASGLVKLSSAGQPGFNKHACTVSLRGRAGESALDGVGVNWRVESLRGAKERPILANCEAFDADKIGTTLILRHWRPGDRYQPIGMQVPVKLQDWFTNRKISRTQRRELLVATTAAGEVFWVEGQRIAEKFKLTPATRRRLIWRWWRR